MSCGNVFSRRGVSHWSRVGTYVRIELGIELSSVLGIWTDLFWGRDGGLECGLAEGGMCTQGVWMDG